MHKCVDLGLAERYLTYGKSHVMERRLLPEEQAEQQAFLMHVRELIPGMSFQQLTATYQDNLKGGTQGAPGDKYALMKERVISLGTCDSDMVEVVGQSDTTQKEDNDDEVGGQSDTTQKEDTDDDDFEQPSKRGTQTLKRKQADGKENQCSGKKASCPQDQQPAHDMFASIAI